MNDRRSRDSAEMVGPAAWRAVIVSVVVAAAAPPAAGQDDQAHPASGALTPRRLSRSIPVVDGYDLQFRRVAAEGLSHTRVAQIVQDDQGFMWFGTQRGLYRYDGQALRLFRNVAAQKTSLSGNYIYSLLKGRENTLWVGSDGFLDSYDSSAERFTQHGIRVDGEPQPPEMNISCLSEDSSALLWLCTRSGLYLFDPRVGRTTVLRNQSGDPSTISSDAIQFVGQAKRGGVWVGTAAGLDLLDSSGEVRSHLPLSRSTTGMAVHEDGAGAVWIIHGIEGELAVMDRSANTLEAWRPSSRDTDADPVKFSSVLEDRDGTMWFGTLNHGVLKLDRGRNRFVRYTTDPSNPYALSDRRVNVLYQDREGLIWTGLHQSEPNFFLPRAPSFQSIQSAGRQSPLVSAILPVQADRLWLGLDLGARILDRRTRAYHDLPALEGKETTSVAESPSGMFWVGTAGQGLWQIDQRSGLVRVFRHDPRNPASLPSDHVEQIRVDQRGAVWAVTWRGLARWDPGSGRFATVVPPGAPPEMTLHTAMFARNDIVWIGSNFGVHRFDPSTRAFQWFRHDPGDVRSLSNDRVNAIHEAADGSIWIGTQIGLDHWDATGSPIKRYGPADGLPGTTVSCVLEGDARQIWLSTDRGIARLSPPTGEFRPYGTADGLPGANMTGWGSCARAESGEMFFAGFAGAVAFFPKNVVDREYLPPVVLTHFRLLDATFEQGGVRVPSLPVGYRSEIELRPSQGKFSIEFAVLSFLSPETNRIRYRLHGLQDEWTEVYGSQRAATYMAVPPGSYSFQVQAASGHGPWNPSIASLDIVMLPPWWGSGPFYGLASVVAVATLLLAYRLRVRQLTRAHIARHEARSAERTRIARDLHDTLLQGFQGLMFRLQAVRELLPSDPTKAIPVLDAALLKGEEAIDEARNAVGDLRSSEKLDRDLEAGLATLAAEAAFLSKDEKTPRWELATKGRARDIPRTVLIELYQAVQEAILNAFRHARADAVTVEVRYGVDGVGITIADDGVGFTEEQLSSERFPGHFGIQGMRERIERLGGRMALSSEPGAGTRVVLSVPAAVAYRTASRTGKVAALLSWLAGSQAGSRD